MKKFLPILVLLAAFCGFLAIQVSMDQVQTSANQSTTVKDKDVRFENLFKTTKVQTIDKKELVFKDLKKPIIILNFWASWCSPCLKELPALKKLAETFPETLHVITINTDEDDQAKAIQKIKDKYKLDLDIVADAGGKLADQFLITNIPYSIIYINGSIYKTHQGYFDFLDPVLDKYFRTVLKK
ncbi:MAG: TlpA family protein disulfide reductase [Bacteriovoracaceae bacterium]